MSPFARTLALIVLVSSGCSVQDVQDALEGAPPLEVSDERVAVPVAVTARVPLDALLPSDLQPLDDGGFAVLDGYGRRILVFGVDGSPGRTLEGDSTWGRPVRFLPDGDGFWMTDPGNNDDPGGVIRIDGEGGLNDFQDAVPGAVALARQGDSLIVSDREGHLWRLDPAERDRAVDIVLAEGEGQRLFADVVLLADGTLVALDVLTPRIDLVPATGEPLAVGRFGHHVGALRMPKSLVELRNRDLLVADSVLGVVQLFDRDGRGLGPLVTSDGLLRLEHPVAVRQLEDGRIAVLDAGVPEVVLLDLPAKSLTLAHDRPRLQRLRVSLAPEGLDQQQPCLHCHDGFVQDSRANWDPEREHHPVDVKPEGETPSFFQLDEDGKLQCATCHSPHGEVGIEEARAAGTEEERLNLVRHRSAELSFVRVSTEDSALCLACHEDAAHGGLTDNEALVGKAKRGPGHLVGRALADALARRPDATLADVEKGSCLGCHAVHAAGSEPLIRAADSGDTCLGCHAEHAKTSRNHPLGRAFGKDTPRPGASARLVLGPDAGIGCVTCHDVLSGTGDSLLREPAKARVLCLACHTDRKGVAASGHGKIRAKGGRGLPACLGCHDVHGASRDAHLVVLDTDEDPTGCRGCHGPGASAATAGVNPGVLGHPVEGAGDGDRAVADCASCHDIHDVREPIKTCAECHVDEGASFDRGGHGDSACADCHPPHRASVAPPPTAMAANPSSRPCLACHATDARAAAKKRLAYWGHPETVFLPDGSRWQPLGEVPLFDDAGVEVPKGQNGSLTCLSCHLVHGPAPGGSHDKLRRPDWKNTCSACHGSDALPLYRYFHDPERRESTVGERP